MQTWRKSDWKMETFSFLFLHVWTPFPHDCLNILLKKIKIYWKIPPIEKSTSHRNPSIDLHYKSINWFESGFSHDDWHLNCIRLVSNCHWNCALHFPELRFINACFSSKFYFENNAFTNGLKKAGIKPVYKKDDLLKKLNTDQSVCYQYHWKHSNVVCTINFMGI